MCDCGCCYLQGACLNEGSLTLFSMRLLCQEETQGYVECEVTDEPVVVLKSQPMKLGNNVEKKTEMTTNFSLVGLLQPKSVIVCEGAK